MIGRGGKGTKPSLTELLVRRVDALHEAAHAVVATAIGCRVTCVELLHDDPNARGRCTYERPNHDDRQFIEAVIGVAGVLATQRVWADERRYSKGDVTDWAGLSADKQSRAVVMANVLLSDNWDRVQQLATRLLNHDRLTNQDPLLTLLLEEI